MDTETKKTRPSAPRTSWRSIIGGDILATEFFRRQCNFETISVRHSSERICNVVVTETVIPAVKPDLHLLLAAESGQKKYTERLRRIAIGMC